MRKRNQPEGSTSLSFEKKILAFFGVILTIIMAVAGIYITVARENRKARAAIAPMERIIALTDSLIDTKQELAISTRGYLLTGKGAYLQGAAEQHSMFHHYLYQLKQHSRGVALQQQRLDSIERFYSQFSALRNSTVSKLQADSLSAQQASLYILASDQMLTIINGLVRDMEQTAKHMLADRRAVYQASVRRASLALRLLLLVFLLSLLSAFVVVFRNSRKRTSAEAALRQQKELIRSIIEHAPLQVNVKDLAGSYLLANQQFANCLHASPEEVVGKTMAHFIPPEQTEVIRRGDNEVIQSGEPTEFEVKLAVPAGLHTYIASKFPLLDDKGQLYAIGSTYVDITPITEAHEALQKSYQKQQQILNGFQQALSATSDLLCIVNAKGFLVMVSDTSQQLLGYTPREMMHKSYLDYVSGKDRDRSQQFVEGVLSGASGTSFTNHCVHKNGTLIPFTWSAHWVAEEGMLYCIARNATESQRAARQLAQSQERLVYAQKIARLGNWEWDIQNNRWSGSEEFYHLYGLKDRKEMLRQKLLLNAIHPDDRERVFDSRDTVLKQGAPLDIEFRIIRANGEERYVHVKGEARFNERHLPVWLSGTIQDITERKNTELLLQQANEALGRRAAQLKESNEELERFAYVASHDLQEPLRMVSSFLSLLQKRLDGQLDDTSKTYIHFATDGAERMKQLIQDLLHYSKLGTMNDHMGPVDMKAVVSNAIHLLTQPAKEAGADIRTEDLPLVFGNMPQLNQVVRNLLSNALKYRQSSAPVIQIGCTDQGDWWEFYIKDNGIGIDPKFFDKIFIIFKRLHTKNKYKGTGIGLALCKKIIERHGGQIRVESEPGKGSTFFFTLKKIN